jgi:ribosome-associated toxin RatA of RatAB toxin-antitoxin module
MPAGTARASKSRRPAEFEADLDQAWEVLTDYNRLSEFIPGMQTSKIVVRNGHNVVVDQRGEARLLFFVFPIRARLAIEEHPYWRIVSRAIEGNFKELRGAYNLEAHGRRVRLHYSGRCTPDFGIPPLIGTILVRNMIEKRFRRDGGRDSAKTAFA